MGLLDALMGNASTADPAKLQADMAPLLAPGETVSRGYKLVRDLFVFTDHRLILVNKQGLTGSKVEYRSIPYRSIVQFSVENAGSFDRESELRLWLSGQPAPLEFTFGKQVDVREVQAVLAAAIAR
ncbi:MAG TPA: PH domain-containing protein [Arenimonas sp.]|nr:PH domain-containing protein [Arenimonas sp.]